MIVTPQALVVETKGPDLNAQQGEGRKELAASAQAALPQLAASTGMALQGKGFERAKKHGATLASLSTAWSQLGKLLFLPLTESLPAAALKELHEACIEAHRSAATPKVRGSIPSELALHPLVIAM